MAHHLNPQLPVPLSHYNQSMADEMETGLRLRSRRQGPVIPAFSVPGNPMTDELRRNLNGKGWKGEGEGGQRTFSVVGTSWTGTP